MGAGAGGRAAGPPGPVGVFAGMGSEKVSSVWRSQPFGVCMMTCSGYHEGFPEPLAEGMADGRELSRDLPLGARGSQK